MIPTLALIFYLILPPSPTLVCSLWLAHAATAEDLASACPAGIDLEAYQVRFVNLWDGKTWCEKNATAIYNPGAACHLGPSLDNFKMDIFQPTDKEKVLCSIKTTNNPPIRDEVAQACDLMAVSAYDEGRATLRYVGPAPVSAMPAPVVIPTPENGIGLYEQPSSAQALATDEHLSWLAGRLIWHGIVKPSCPGDTSGLDPRTLAANGCGMASAAEAAKKWQNQFDADILEAARAEGVPARLLKRIMIQESQFWPQWDDQPAGEVGMVQITTNAADQYLRWYVDGYAGLSQPVQELAQAEFVRGLRCELCTVDQAIEKERANISIYARVLKAYRYQAADWRGALVLWNGEAYMKIIDSGSEIVY